MKKKVKIKAHLNITTIILLSFLLVILVGAGALCLPFSSATGSWTDFTTALFTATSATCVTGLIVRDTASFWSPVGKVIIILLIQIGGLGIMTIISIIAMVFGKNASLRTRTIAMQTAGAVSYQSVKNTLKTIFVGTAAFEFTGAAILSIRFIPKFGLGRGVVFAIFHSVSAFCNAGFDIFGLENGASLAQFSSDPLVLITISLLIIIGGIGFIFWSDVAAHGVHLKKYSFHSKIALMMTLILLSVGSVGLFVTERNAAFSEFDLGTQMLNAFFQSTTLRTAGFAAVDQASLSPAGTFISYVLMFIGGTAGSTAGGLKTTTFAVLVLTAITTLRRRDDIVLFKRKVAQKSVRDATAIGIIYLTAVVVSTIFICAFDSLPTKDVVFETISAVATVGLSTGITAALSVASKYVIILLMFAGRIGGLSFMLAFSAANKPLTTERPTETILIG